MTKHEIVPKGLFQGTVIWERDLKTFNMTRKIQFSLCVHFFSIDNLQSSFIWVFLLPVHWCAVPFSRLLSLRTQFRLNIDYSEGKSMRLQMLCLSLVPNKTDGNLIEGWRTLCGLRRTSHSEFCSLSTSKPLNPLQMLSFH